MSKLCICVFWVTFFTPRFFSRIILTKSREVTARLHRANQRPFRGQCCPMRGSVLTSLLMYFWVSRSEGGACAPASSLRWPQLPPIIGLWLVGSAPSSLLIGWRLMLSEHWGAAHTQHTTHISAAAAPCKPEEVETRKRKIIALLPLPFLSSYFKWWMFQFNFRKIQIEKETRDCRWKSKRYSDKEMSVKLK